MKSTYAPSTPTRPAKSNPNHLGQSWSLLALLVISCLSFVILLASF